MYFSTHNTNASINLLKRGEIMAKSQTKGATKSKGSKCCKCKASAKLGYENSSTSSKSEATETKSYS